MQILLLVQLASNCLGVLLMQIIKLTFGNQACLQSLSENWVTLIAEPTSSVLLVLNTTSI